MFDDFDIGPQCEERYFDEDYPFEDDDDDFDGMPRPYASTLND